MTRSAPRPSPGLVRRVTDRQLFEQLLASGALTRAELAERTGISKPTVSEGVRRLTEAEVLAEGAEQLGKRGPAGRLYGLHPQLGSAVAVSAAPEGVVAELLALNGVPRRQAARGIGPADRVADVLTGALRELLADESGPVLGCAVSIAGPVDVATGEPIRMPHAPLPLDGFSPRTVVGAMTGCPVEVDNDVNWMALAEQEHGAAREVASFLLWYLGAGVGSAVVLDGGIVRGSRGLAGEVAYLVVPGPDARARPLYTRFAEWGLLQAGSAAIDVGRVRALLVDPDEAARPTRDALLDALADAISSASALLDPSVVLVGGPWGAAGDLVEQVNRRVAARAVVPVAVRRTDAGPATALVGAGLGAVRAARASVVAAL